MGYKWPVYKAWVHRDRDGSNPALIYLICFRDNSLSEVAGPRNGQQRNRGSVRGKCKVFMISKAPRLVLGATHCVPAAGSGGHPLCTGGWFWGHPLCTGGWFWGPPIVYRRLFLGATHCVPAAGSGGHPLCTGGCFSPR